MRKQHLDLFLVQNKERRFLLEAIAAKDPDYLTKIAEKEGNTAEDGGILSPGGKILPFGGCYYF